MKVSPSSVKWFTLFKLPAAYFTGVRVQKISDTSCSVRVRLKWANQNPFRSMFWAVQGMAAELSTGALIMRLLSKTDLKFSMLLIETNATFSKKAVGTIRFDCTQGEEISSVIQKAVNEPQQIWLHAKGVDDAGDEVSSFSFLWSLKIKN